jgi:uncharacterized glyoxalase superfamily protein PhnB
VGINTSLVVHGHGEYEGSTAPGSEDAGATILFLSVDDVDAMVETLRGQGVMVLSEPADQPWGDRDAAVLDPDGVEIHLIPSLSDG